MIFNNLKLVQNCWVVDDLQVAIEGWLDLGVGPFFCMEYTFPDALYRGSVEPLSFRAAVAQAGSIQIELIEQTSPGPSAYRDVVPKGQSGLHHMCHITDTFSADIEQLRSQGIEMATEFLSHGVSVAYADTRKLTGFMLELVPALDILLQLNALVKDAAENWDGRDPIRQFAPA